MPYLSLYRYKFPLARGHLNAARPPTIRTTYTITVDDGQATLQLSQHIIREEPLLLVQSSNGFMCKRTR